MKNLHILRVSFVFLLILLDYPAIIAGNEDTDEVIRKVKEHLEAKEKAKDSMFDLLQPSKIWEVFTSLAKSFP